MADHGIHDIHDRNTTYIREKETRSGGSTIAIAVGIILAIVVGLAFFLWDGDIDNGTVAPAGGTGDVSVTVESPPAAPAPVESDAAPAPAGDDAVAPAAE